MKTLPISAPEARALLENPDFWSHYPSVDSFEEVGDYWPHRFSVALSPGTSLLLEFNGSSTALELAAPSLTVPARLGWIDQGHSHSSVFRWSEILPLSKRASAYDPEANYAHAFLLLAHFVQISRDEEVGKDEEFREEIAKALVAVGIPRGDLFSGYLCLASYSGKRFNWVRDASLGWVASEEWCYSPRKKGNTDFPFAALREILQQAGVVDA
ncbi:MAG: hypothetical protein IT202_03240 [Fimbriimonadaceae bacterium]|nr:hypothetical protein [Fimbriimonadaceae bacterium]